MPGRRRKRSRRTAGPPEPEAVRRQAAALFERRFLFEPPADGWRLPEAARLFPEQDWQVRWHGTQNTHRL